MRKVDKVLNRLNRNFTNLDGNVRLGLQIESGKIKPKGIFIFGGGMHKENWIASEPRVVDRHTGLIY